MASGICIGLDTNIRIFFEILRSFRGTYKILENSKIFINSGDIWTNLQLFWLFSSFSLLFSWQPVLSFYAKRNPVQRFPTCHFRGFPLATLHQCCSESYFVVKTPSGMSTALLSHRTINLEELSIKLRNWNLFWFATFPNKPMPRRKREINSHSSTNIVREPQ